VADRARPRIEAHHASLIKEQIMNSAQPPLRAREDAEEPEIDDPDEVAAAIEDEFDADDEIEPTDELSEETGIDLSDASELDADNVTADEEFDRVRQAED
jgi:hypothetical protein